MSKQWYYSKDGQPQGPVTPEQLKGLAASGLLAPNDFVWTEGMSQWAEARTLKGLYPTPAGVQSPPLPAAVPAVSTVPRAPATYNAPISDKVPALWNPKWLGAWSLLFSWAFGAFLLARNWETLGEPAKAKRAMFWFYSLFPFLLVIAVMPQVSKHIGLAVLGAFCWIEVSPQMKFVKKKFNDQYARRSWLKPVGIAVPSVLGGILAAGIVATIFGAHPPQEKAVVVNGGQLPAGTNAERRNAPVSEPYPSSDAPKPTPSANTSRSDTEPSEDEVIQLIAKGVVALITTGDAQPPEHRVQGVEGILSRWAHTTPDRFNQMMRKVAEALGAQNQEKTRHLLTIEPSRREEDTVNGKRIVFVVYGGGAVKVGFVYNPIVVDFSLMSVQVDDKQYTPLTPGGSSAKD